MTATINELISAIKEHGQVYLHYKFGHAPQPFVYHLVLTERGDVCECYDHDKSRIAIAHITDIETLSKKIDLCDGTQHTFAGMTTTPTL